MEFLLCPLLAAALSAGVSAFLLHTRLGLRLAPDLPNERSLHRAPIPRLGGLGVVLAVVVAAWCAGPGFHVLAWLAGGLALVSLLDDLRDLPAGLRLLVHLGAAAAWVFTVLPAPTFVLGLALVLLLAWGINLYNFMDGANGLAGGMALIGFGSLAAAAWLGGDARLALFCLAVAAAALGFLVFNFDPARIFLGDCGSIPLGFLAGALGLWGWTRGVWDGFVPALAFAPFLADATLTLARRALRGEKVWHAHREHYYQRLVRMGWSHRRLALGAYALMLCCGLLALLPQSWRATAVCGVLAAHAAIFLGVDRLWHRHESAAAKA
jgi:UDP-N-acetylmuramyl pentapeptide phosphotransferase/UDP-N-acetylglucosamine-1-phosphate transferase